MNVCEVNNEPARRDLAQMGNRLSGISGLEGESGENFSDRITVGPCLSAAMAAVRTVHAYIGDICHTFNHILSKGMGRIPDGAVILGPCRAPHWARGYLDPKFSSRRPHLTHEFDGTYSMVLLDRSLGNLEKQVALIWQASTIKMC